MRGSMTLRCRMPAPATDTLKPVNRGLIFTIIAFALMMMSIDATIVATALHALQEDLGAPINWTSWTITAYWFGYVVMLPVSGRLSERYGPRRIFLLSTLAFAVASLLCGLAPNVYLLVLFRALQSAGGAGLTPAATGIIVTWFRRSRDRMLGLFGAVFPVGAMIGPIFGGLFVTYASWRDVFFVNVPIGLIMASLGWWIIPRDRPAGGPRRSLDLWGMAWLGLAVVAGMLAIGILGNPQAGPLSWDFILSASACTLFAGRFLRHIRWTAEPFLAPRLIYGQGFGATNFLNAVYGGAASGAVTLVPFYAATRYGLDALDAGTLLIAQGVAAITFSTVAAYVLRWSGYRLPFHAGGLLMATGLWLLAPLPGFGFSGYSWLATATCLIGAGAGIMGPASRNACLQLVPEQAPTMAALRATAQELGVIVTLAIITAIMARAAAPSDTLATIYAIMALTCLLIQPIIRRVPEHHGAW